MQQLLSLVAKLNKTSVVMHRTNYPGKRASLSGILTGPILGLFGVFFVGIPQPLILGATLRPSTHLISIIKSLSFYFGVCVCVCTGACIPHLSMKWLSCLQEFQDETVSENCLPPLYNSF